MNPAKTGTPAPLAAPDGDALLKLLAEAAPAVLWSTDRELRFTSSMGAALKHLGLAPNQIVGMSLYDYFGTRDPGHPPIAHHRAALAGQKSTFGFDWKDRSFHAWVDPLVDPSGSIIGTVGIALDITDRKRAENALQDSEERWKAVVNQAPDFIMILDRDGRIFYINRMNEGYTPEDVLGSSAFDFTLPAYHDVARQAYARVFETGETVTFDVEASRTKDTTAWYRNRAGPLHRNGKIANLILIATDITESKRTEEALRESVSRMRLLAARLQSAREEERKRISLEIHDRLGQALTGLKLGLSSLAARLGKDAEGRRRVKDIFRSLDETIQTVREISTELRPAILDSLGLRAAIEWQAREFQTRTGVRCHLDLPRRDVSLDLDRSAAVFRIFQEILTNVTRHSKARQVTVLLAATPDKLVLSVADNGKGISKKSLEDPSSLGLLGMRERALALGGALDVRGRRGKGTTVTATLPLGRRKKK